MAGEPPIDDASRFGDVETWVFDMDNTLYPAGLGLMQQINARIAEFIMRELGVDRARAQDVRNRYYRRYGITLTGLARHHGVLPERFLNEVHDIDLSALRPDPALQQALARLGAMPGRRLVVHTNAARVHADRVLSQAGLAGAFDAVYAIEDKDFTPKPRPEAYMRVIDAAAFAPTRAAMIEDTLANLKAPKDLGMGTVWLTGETRQAADAHVDRRIDALAPFLAALT
ncbi:MAG: pyrimidine 5'-nucleotidase [Pseudomonadota bacterium]